MKPILYMLLLAMFFPTQILPITIQNNLEKWAALDILIYKEEIDETKQVFPFDKDPARLIACYSFLFNEQEKIWLWENLYTHFQLMSFISPTAHFFMPLTRDNPLTITLSPEDIKKIAGDDTNELFVVIRQRTYAYQRQLNDILFFDSVTLMREFKPLTATITVQASGLINPLVFDQVPDYLKSIYPEAHGSAS